MIETLLEYFQVLVNGLAMTVGLTFSALVLGTCVALACTVILNTGGNIVKIGISSYLTLFTGTPLLVQLFLIYYGPGQFEWIKTTMIWDLFVEPWFCAILALSLNCGAYTTLLFNGAVKGINKGQWEACYSLGLTHWQTLKVLMPYALKRAYPAYSNEVILLLKGSSLASTITIMDIMGWSQRLNAQTYDTLMVFSAAGILYLSLNLTITLLMRSAEGRILFFEKI